MGGKAEEVRRIENEKELSTGMHQSGIEVKRRVLGLFCLGGSNVVVCGEEDIRLVYEEGGCVGSSASTGSLKPLFMRKKRRRFRDLDADADHVEPWRLTLVEAYFLMNEGLLEVKCFDGRTLALAEAWAIFGESEAFSSKRRFAVMYTAYKRLRARGWVVKMGQTYGGHFVIYQGDVDFFHSQFCILVRDENNEVPCKFSSFPSPSL